MSRRVAYYGGEFVPESEARVSVFDSALHLGDMAFESTRTFRHRPFRLREHLERLGTSLRLLDIDCGLTLDELEQVTLQTLGRNLPTQSEDVDWQIVHNISRGPLPVYRAAFPGGLRPTVLIHCWPLVPHLAEFAAKYKTGASLVCASRPTVPASIVDPHAKTRSRVHYRVAQLEAARRAPGSWPVLFDPDGFLAEGPGWNVFLVKDGVLCTPTTRNVLPGISRSITLDLARELELDVSEADLTRDDLLGAQEVFCTATSFCLVHARSVDENQIADGGPGPVFAQLRAGWQRVVGLDFIAQATAYAARLAAWERKALS